VGIRIGRSSPGCGVCAYLTSSALGNGNTFSVRSHVRVAKGVGFVEAFGEILGEAGNSAWMGRFMSMSGGCCIRTEWVFVKWHRLVVDG
jgi:hypothetical protein